jgi:hypothetical protein
LLLAGFLGFDAAFFVLIAFGALVPDAISLGSSFGDAADLALHSTTFAPAAISPSFFILASAFSVDR